MARIEGAKELQAKFKKRIVRAERDHRVAVLVGYYNAKYALYVHENREMKWKGRERMGRRPDGSARKGKYWDPQGKGQSQYLIQPYREKINQIRKIYRTIYSRTKDLALGLVIAGQFLQRESQQLVPVDSGNLKGSAFTEVEKR
jgi:hypothetical protein